MIKIPFLFIAISVIVISISNARPPDLTIPENVLGAANEQGFVRVWRIIDEIDFGDGAKLPLRFDFGSERKYESQHLGDFWRPVLFEAQAVMVRSNLLEVTMLCGKKYYFRPVKGEKGKFYGIGSGDGVWTGEMDKRKITVTRDDGWELTYVDGLIKRLKTDQGRVFDWRRDHKDRVTEITEGTSNKPLRIKYDSRNGFMNSMQINDRMYKIESNENGITKLIRPDGAYEGYELNKEKALLNIDYNGEKSDTFGWESLNGSIAKENDWKYSVTYSKKTGVRNKETGELDITYLDRPKIVRNHAKSGKKEVYHKDNSKGIVVQTLESGVIETTYTFRSEGPYYGKVRKVEHEKDGKKSVVRMRSYDELGRCIRDIWHDGREVTYKYFGDTDTVIDFREGQDVILEKKMNQNGLLKWENNLSDKREVTYSYFGDGELKSREFSYYDGLDYSFSFNSDGKLQSMSSSIGKILYKFDSNSGNLIAKKMPSGEIINFEKSKSENGVETTVLKAGRSLKSMLAPGFSLLSD